MSQLCLDWIKISTKIASKIFHLGFSQRQKTESTVSVSLNFHFKAAAVKKNEKAIRFFLQFFLSHIKIFPTLLSRFLKVLIKSICLRIFQLSTFFLPSIKLKKRTFYWGGMLYKEEETQSPKSYYTLTLISVACTLHAELKGPFFGAFFALR